MRTGVQCGAVCRGTAPLEKEFNCFPGESQRLPLAVPISHTIEILITEILTSKNGNAEGKEHLQRVRWRFSEFSEMEVNLH